MKLLYPVHRYLPEVWVFTRNDQIGNMAYANLEVFFFVSYEVVLSHITRSNIIVLFYSYIFMCVDLYAVSFYSFV